MEWMFSATPRPLYQQENRRQTF